MSEPQAAVELVAGSGIRFATGNGSGRLVFDRPRHGNTLDSTAFAGISAVLHRMEQDTSLAGLVLESRVGGVFCSGGSYLDPGRSGPSPHYAAQLSECFALWSRRRYPVIALVNGACRAFGCALALSADVTVATRSAGFQLPELSGGVVPSFAIATLRSAHESRLVRELVFTCAPLSAERAHQRGLVSDLCATQAQAEDTVAGYLRLWANAGAAATRRAATALHRIDTAPGPEAVQTIAEEGVADQLERFRTHQATQAYLSDQA